MIKFNYSHWQHWKIKQVKERNRTLKLAIEEKRQKKTYNNLRLDKLKKNNVSGKDQLPLFEQKVEHLGNRVDMRREKIATIRQTHLQKQSELKVVVKRRIQQLLTFIFPLTTVTPSM